MKVLGDKRCYYCGAPAQGGEHIPPKQMFRVFNCDSITVPSCDEHNSKKSGHDQAIVSALLIPLYAGRSQHPLEPEVEQAIQAAASSFERAKRNAVKTPFLMNPPRGLEDLPDLAYLMPSIDLTAWIRQLTAGLIYDAIGSASSAIGWRRSIVWSPEWFSSDGPWSISYGQAFRVLSQNRQRRLALERLFWQEGWSAHPKPYPARIYSFQIHFASKRDLVLRHRFYNRYTWYVFFTAPKSKVLELRRKMELI